GGHVDPAGVELGEAGLVAEVPGHTRAGDDGAEWAVGGGPGEGAAGGGELADDVGVQVGPGQDAGGTGLHANEGTAGVAAVGGAAVAGGGVADAGVGECAGSAAGGGVGDHAAEVVVGVGLGALGDRLPERVIRRRHRGAAGDDRGEGAAGGV